MKKRPKIKLKGAAEWDTFTRWRNMMCYLDNSKVVKKIKRQYNKRFRKLGKESIKQELDQ
jgi:phage regulator Rha-like protein